MIARLPRALYFLLILGFFGSAIGGDNTSKEEAAATTEAAATATEDEESKEVVLVVGNPVAGEERYKKSCVNCHGAAGKGVASYPKVSGNEISYTKEKLETYRAGTKIGPNSSLMIMMAKPLTDEEIANLAAYLEIAKN